MIVGFIPATDTKVTFQYLTGLDDAGEPTYRATGLRYSWPAAVTEARNIVRVEGGCSFRVITTDGLDVTFDVLMAPAPTHTEEDQ